MGPAEGERDVALLGQRAIAAIAVDLQHALEAGQVRDRPLGRAVGRIDVGHRRRVGSAPRSIVARIGPELAGLGPPSPGIEHRRGRLVGEQLGRGLQLLQQPLVQRAQQEGGAAGPVREGRAVEVDALAGVDLGLAIERQVIGVLGDHDVGDRRLGRQAALDQARRRRRLDHHVLAGAAGVLGPAHHQHPELGRDDVQPFGDVLADQVQRARAARAGLVLDVDDALDPRQMRRQRAAVGAPLARALAARAAGSASLRPSRPRPPRSAGRLPAPAAI